MKEPFIFKDIAGQSDGSESSRAYLVVDKSTGKSEVVIEKTLSKRFPATEYDKAMSLYEQLNCSGMVHQIEELKRV